jgi:hypothetical protein
MSQNIQKQVAVLEISERFVDSATLFALFEAGVLKYCLAG